MAEIRDLMHDRLARLEQGRGSNVDLEAARKTVRRHRRTRAALTGVAASAAVIAVSAGAWLGYTAWTQEAAIAPSPSPSPSPSPVASTSPSPTPTPEPTLRARPINPSEAELLAMAENPATGEVWLAQPEPIDAPTWHIESLEFVQEYDLEGWHRVGGRHGRDIVIWADSTGLRYFEVEADGTDPAEVIAPAPHDTPYPESYVSSGIRVDTDTFYESLAIFGEWTAPDGLVVRPHEAPRGLFADAKDFTYTTVREFGGNAVVRVERPLRTDARDWYGEEAMVPAIDDRTVGVLYAIRKPFGLLVEAPSRPQANDGPLEFTTSGVGWAPPDPERDWPGDNGFVDFFDEVCGFELSFWPLAIDEDPAQWAQAGAGPVYIPTPQNPLAQATYETWKNFVVEHDYEDHPEIPHTPTLESFLDAPAIVGIPADDDSGWWLLTSRVFSTRMGC